MSETTEDGGYRDESALENLYRVRSHYMEEKDDAVAEDDEIQAAYLSGIVAGLNHAIEVEKHRESGTAGGA